MKKIYTKFFLLSFAGLMGTCAGAQESRYPNPINNPVQTELNRQAGYVENKSESPFKMAPQTSSFGTDQIVKNDPATNQRNAKVSVAFNGWVYAGFTTQNGTTGGITVRRSKNGGTTWTDIMNVSFPNTEYPSLDLVVCGTDTNNLFLFVAGINHNLSSSTYVAWIDRYNATTGAFIAEQYYASNSTSKIYDIALASDYKFPSVVSSPFSVAALYSKTSSPADSLIYVASVDGGINFNTRKVVAYTGSWYRKVSLAYGKGFNYSNGRYFAAWEQRQANTSEIGHILFAHTIWDPQDNFSTPIYIDSAGAGMVNICRHPSICVMQGTIDNDSANLTAIVVVDRQYSAVDHDILGLYSKKTVYSTKANWTRFDVDNGTNYAIQPNVSYDPAYGNFLATYFDSSAGKLPYLVHQYNMIVPNSWVLIKNQYNDQTTSLKAAWPKVQINPVYTQAVFVWNKEGVSNNGVTLFDAEYFTTGVNENVSHNTGLGLPYPDPASDVVLIGYELGQSSHVSLRLMDIGGREVMTLVNGDEDAGKHVVTLNVADLPAGYYFCELTSGSTRITRKMVVVH